jgi:hypothetical protein
MSESGENRRAPADAEISDSQPVDFTVQEWWTIFDIVRRLHISRDRLKHEVSIINSRPELLKSEIVSGGRRTVLHRDLVLRIQEEVKKSREVPQGWKTAEQLANEIRCDKQCMRKVLKRVLLRFPKPNEHFKECMPDKFYIIYYSPEVCEEALREFEKYPFIPSGCRTLEEIQRAFRSSETQKAIPQILSIMESQHLVKATPYMDRQGEIVEGYPEGTTRQVRDFLIKLSAHKH